MPSNYDAICKDNRERYGTVGARKSGKLAAERYDDRTHFIFELLQNAEDALGRRGDWHGPRDCTFKLTPTCLTLSHYGQPFDEADVRSVCDFDESTKNESSIGRFGIGFKSVYAVTDRPEIHSGDEDFAIEDYVFPQRVNRTTRAVDETQIVLPFRPNDETVSQRIAAGFQHLGPGALLFLRNIDEINWSVEGGASGVYMRSAPQLLGPNVKRLTVIGQESGKPDVDQNWLIFHRDVSSVGQDKVGRVEVAFSLVSASDASERWSVQPVAESPLVVFFPTVVPTNLGFLVQGPYLTTPSRDNISRDEPWNQHLVNETVKLLVAALRWLRDRGMLDTSALRCLPIDRARFPEGSIFAPIFNAVRQAFFDEALLPRFDGGFVSAGQARLARTQELRDLFSPEQVEWLFGAKGCAWLTGDITQDRAPELRKYLLQELDVPEVTPEQVVPRLDETFLSAQPDEWITRLYAFLNGQKALASRLSSIPLVRLDDGTHVVACENGSAKAFLPSAFKTSFPTVRRVVSSTPDARSFLVSLGLTEPDPVDDVVWNVLPKYRAAEVDGAEVDGDEEAYSADIERIRIAFDTDSKAQREKLLTELRRTPFVMVVDVGTGKDYVSRPGVVYIATDRLKALFAGVPRVFVVDDSYDCLRGEDVRDLLVACGASRYLAPQAISTTLTHDEKAQLRKGAGLERASWQDPPEDYTIRGLGELLEGLRKLQPEEAAARAAALWDALVDLEGRGTSTFSGSYRWGFAREIKVARFDAHFVRQLNQASWIPDARGELVPPALVTFESLGWKANPFLLSKIAFKPPIIDQLAKEAGIDPDALHLLRKYGITSAADLATRLGIDNNTAESPQGDMEPNADSSQDDVERSDEAADAAAKTGAEDDESDALDDSIGDDLSVAGPGSGDEPDPGATDSGREGKDIEGATGRGHRTNGAPGARSAGNEVQRAKETRRPGRRNLTGRDGLAEQAARLSRRLTSFFDISAPEDEDEEESTTTSTGWQSRLVCLDVEAGGLQLEVGPLDGLPNFVKKLRVVGAEWDGFVLAANAKARPTRVPVRPGTGPWRWEAMGFEEEQDLGLDKLALEAIEPTGPVVFRVDADGVGQPIKSTTLALGQTYRLLVPPNIGEDLGSELVDGWRIWSLDLAAPLSPTTRQTLASLGVGVGEAWPRLEWALTPPSMWRATARGASYPIFEAGTELIVNMAGVSIEEGDVVMFFLHGPSGTVPLPISSNGLVSLGTPSAGRWACALLHSRTSVLPATLIFEVAENAAEHVAASWAVSAPEGVASLEVTAPPGWPISVRWNVLGSETLATLYGNDDRTVTVEGVRSLLETRAARAPVADLVVDLRELGRRLIPHDGRTSWRQVYEQLTDLWQQRSGLVQGRAGAWLQLMPTWFEPATTRLGYGIEAHALLTDADVPYDLAAWLLTVDERTDGSISRSPSRVLVLTTDIDAVLRDCRAWVDSACTVAKVRDAIVTDGSRWTAHRKGDRRLKRREWDLNALGTVDDMITDLAEGL